VDIFESGRKHQSEDEFEDSDIIHAVDNARYVGDDGDDMDKALYLGPDRSGRLLEIVVAVRADGSEVVVHAMKMRRTYEELLRRLGGPDA
jgi:hypothetical protein